MSVGSTGRAAARLAPALAACAMFTSSPTATASAPPNDTAPFVDAFVAWAEANGGPVSAPACYVPTATDVSVATCYGIGGAAEVVVATIEIDDTGAPGAIAVLDVVALPPTAPTAPGGTSAGAPEASTTGPATTFGPGLFVVGTDIEPGTYKATVPGDSGGCYWERVSGLGGELAEVIANDGVAAGDTVTVEIDPSDVGFASDGCGTWTLLE